MPISIINWWCNYSWLRDIARVQATSLYPASTGPGSIAGPGYVIPRLQSNDLERRGGGKHHYE